MSDNTVDDPGRTAFDAYTDKVGGINVGGDPIPAWDDLTDPIREAWRTAADAVLNDHG